MIVSMLLEVHHSCNLTFGVCCEIPVVETLLHEGIAHILFSATSFAIGWQDIHHEALHNTPVQLHKTVSG